MEASDIIALVALVISFISVFCTLAIQFYSLKIQKQTVENNTAQNHFSTLVDIYSLGQMYTSNMSRFDTEIEKLNQLISDQISGEQFDVIYHGEEYVELRKAVSYFDFLQSTIDYKGISREECYSIVSFPISFYNNISPIIRYAQLNKVHDFDQLDAFFEEYLDFIKRDISEG